MAQRHTDPFRFYRRQPLCAEEISFQLCVNETDLWVTVLRRAYTEALVDQALELVQKLRGQINAWISLDPEFAASLEPVSVPPHAPAVVRRMADAARLMNVGPMAAVAGAIAERVAEALAEKSPECIVENGGDSMLYSSRERVVGLISSPGEGARLGLLVPAGAFPVSVCASSAVIGHSLSLGRGDLAVVRAKNACLADAAATAYCNMLQGPDDVARAAAHAAAAGALGIEGLFVQCGEAMAVWGAMELTAVNEE